MSLSNSRIQRKNSIVEEIEKFGRLKASNRFVGRIRASLETYCDAPFCVNEFPHPTNPCVIFSLFDWLDQFKTSSSVQSKQTRQTHLITSFEAQQLGRFREGTTLSLLSITSCTKFAHEIRFHKNHFWTFSYFSANWKPLWRTLLVATKLLLDCCFDRWGCVIEECMLLGNTSRGYTPRIWYNKNTWCQKPLIFRYDDGEKFCWPAKIRGLDVRYFQTPPAIRMRTETPKTFAKFRPVQFTWLFIAIQGWMIIKVCLITKHATDTKHVEKKPISVYWPYLNARVCACKNARIHTRTQGLLDEFKKAD